MHQRENRGRTKTVVSIGIQARSGSTRLPGKSSRVIRGKTVVEWVLGSAYRAASIINSRREANILCDVSLLIPYGDPLLRELGDSATIREGSEHDVLSRFVDLRENTKADFIVRLTGDNPCIPGFLIARHVFIAVAKGYDYFSNVDERFRTAPDGFDCEVMSAEMLEWLNDFAKEDKEREHVTLKARTSPPRWAKSGAVIDQIDLSHLSFTVNTEEDLERVAEALDRMEAVQARAEEALGKSAVHGP